MTKVTSAPGKREGGDRPERNAGPEPALSLAA
jgi:hypothetical protein